MKTKSYSRSYATLYDKIITDTMSYVDTTHMNRFKLKHSDIKTDNLIYASAAASSAPITLVYTPAGSGKSALVKDRVRALKSIGLKGEEIIVLNMNIAKSKQMLVEMPDVNIMTFSDFTHNIFKLNYDKDMLSDTASIINTLRLQPISALLSDLISKLSITNPQDKATALTLFTNAHLDFVIDTLLSISKTDYALESMICQNKIYTFDKTPYNAKAIIINGVHNMPIPILCSILAYVNRYHCNLFMTGSPDETIYDFNMAYNNAMNVISAYASSKNIDIIHLQNTKIISDDIQSVLDMKPNAKLSNVSTINLTVNSDTSIYDMVKIAIGPSTNYLKTKIDQKKPVLIIARSRNELSEIKQMLNDYYKPLYPDLNILDLTVIQPTSTTYGEIASKYVNNIRSKYPTGITIPQFFYELYNCMSYEISTTGVPTTKTQCTTDRDNMMSFCKDNNISLNNTNLYKIEDLVRYIIDIESHLIQNHINDIQNNMTLDMNGADIILSTIHTAIDIRNDDVIIFMRNFNENADKNIYRVALSRANKSELIIFANYGQFEIPLQLYLKTHIA